MLALCVDDEPIILEVEKRMVEMSPMISKAEAFTSGSKALEWLQTHKPDIAFLDIQLRGMTGLDLAKQIHEIYPGLPLVFCTGYDEYARDAFRLHAAGYLSKPVQPVDIQEELDHIFGKNYKKALLRVVCFGGFDAYAGEKRLPVGRKKTNEVLAYLIDRKGGNVSAKEICAALWEDSIDDQKNLNYLYKLIADLKKALKEVGAEEVLIYQNNSYAIDPEKIECDYYDFLRNDEKAIQAFRGEYMNKYSWAEETCAILCKDGYY